MGIQSDNTSDTESKILKAAEREFLEKGYAGARTASIAEAAGVTHAMLHYYFRTKEKLFEKIVSDKIGTIGNLVLSAFGDENLPLAERVKQGVERHFDFIAANRDLPRFLINEVYANPTIFEGNAIGIKGITSCLLDKLQADIDEGASRGECRQLDARMLISDIVSLNVFPFVAAPIFEVALGGIYESYGHYLALRKAENVRTILDKLMGCSINYPI